eukprot:Awhi_evm1s1378
MSGSYDELSIGVIFLVEKRRQPRVLTNIGNTEHSRSMYLVFSPPPLWNHRNSCPYAVGQAGVNIKLTSIYQNIIIITIILCTKSSVLVNGSDSKMFGMNGVVPQGIRGLDIDL